MLRLPFLILILIPTFLVGQERSITDLYNKSMMVYENIQSGEHIEALEKADEILGEYNYFPGGDKYYTYLYMYKAEAYLRLGDVLLSELCSKAAQEMAEGAGENSLVYTIENNLAALDIEKYNYDACFDKCRALLVDSYKPDKSEGISGIFR